MPLLDVFTTKRLCGIALTGFLLCFVDISSAYAQPALTASFDWSVPDRLVVDAEGRVTNFKDSNEISPDAWPVNFDACASSGSIVSYRWSVDGAAAGETNTCDGFTHAFAAEGVYDVTLTVVDSDGASSAPVHRRVHVQDFLVVAMGDSYASGEGAPDIAIPPDAWINLAAAADDLIASREALDTALADLLSIRNDLADRQDALQDAVAARIAAKVDLDNLLAETNAVRDRRQDVINAQNAVNSARNRRDASCPLPVVECSAAQAALTARQAELASARASLTVELAKFGLDHLSLNEIEAALDDLERPKIDLHNAALLAESAAQTAVETARDAEAVAEAAADLARDAVAAAQSAFDAYMQEAQAVWGLTDEDRRCHRSSASGQVQAALRLEQDDPKTSVTLLHLACSGATITNGLVGFYEGVEGGPRNIDPQVIDAGTWTATREIDAVVISIGGNDIEFAGIVETCIAEEPCFEPRDDATQEALQQAAFEQFCESLPGSGIEHPLGDVLPYQLCMQHLDTASLGYGNAAVLFQEAFDLLPDRYSELNTSIEGWMPDLPSDRVYLTEYPDLTKDETGSYCGFDPADDPVAMMLQIPGITQPEMEWADTGPLSMLNEAIAEAARTHGWNVVDGIYDLFERHGYCSTEGWVVRLHESLVQQEDIYGTVHPTRIGQNAYRDRIHAALIEDLYIVPPGDPALPTIPRAADGAEVVKNCPDAYPDLLVTDYDPRRKEFFTFQNTGDLPIDLDGCHAATWNAFAETVIWSAALDGILLPGHSYSVANSDGDLILPAKSMANGPGALTILGKSIEAGQTVQDALGSIVSSVVYLDASTIFGQNPVAGAGKATEGIEFLEALAMMDAALPSAYALQQNYPNPFNPTTSIDFELPEEAHVRLEVFDMLGRRVVGLVDRQLSAGRHQVNWNANAMASGVYVYRIEAGSFVATRRMMLLK